MSEEPTAQVREINGQIVLIDPIGCAVARAVAKHHCKNTLDAQAERVRHFASRVEELNVTPEVVVIVLINVDDVHGRDLAEMLMPNNDWQPYRDRGEVPFARGLAVREPIQQYLNSVDEEAGKKLADRVGLSVVVVDHGTFEVFPVE